MRFRSVTQGSINIQKLLNVVGTVSKLAKTCIMRINKSKIAFILSERLLQGGTQMWCEMPKESFFSQYDMEGFSQEHNDIYLEIVMDGFAKAFKSAQTARYIKLKLIKRTLPCISIEAELQSPSGYNRIVVHDIPAKVIPTRLWSDYRRPFTDVYDVSLHLPAMKALRNVVDRMKNLSSNVTISANRGGELVLKIETDMVNVSTFFRGLIQPICDDHSMQPNRSASVDSARMQEFSSIQIDVKRLAQYLMGHQLSTERVILNLVAGQSVQFIDVYNNAIMQYVIPAVSTGNG